MSREKEFRIERDVWSKYFDELSMKELAELFMTARVNKSKKWIFDEEDVKELSDAQRQSFIDIYERISGQKFDARRIASSPPIPQYKLFQIETETREADRNIERTFLYHMDKQYFLFLVSKTYKDRPYEGQREILTEFQRLLEIATKRPFVTIKSKTPTYYEVLGVPSDVSTIDLNKKLIELITMINVLIDPEKRKEYDNSLKN